MFSILINRNCVDLIYAIDCVQNTTVLHLGSILAESDSVYGDSGFHLGSILIDND